MNAQAISVPLCRNSRRRKESGRRSGRSWSASAERGTRSERGSVRGGSVKGRRTESGKGRESVRESVSGTGSVSEKEKENGRERGNGTEAETTAKLAAGPGEYDTPSFWSVKMSLYWLYFHIRNETECCVHCVLTIQHNIHITT